MTRFSTPWKHNALFPIYMTLGCRKLVPETFRPHQILEMCPADREPPLLQNLHNFCPGKDVKRHPVMALIELSEGDPGLLGQTSTERGFWGLAEDPP